MITFVVLSKNNEKTINKTFESTKDVGPVVLIDTGSTDATLSIAERYNHVTVYTHPFTSFGPLRNYGASLAQTDWVFALDSDESLSLPLIDELKNLSLQKNTVYKVPSKNFYRQKEVQHCGWWPDYKLRLYNRHETSFDARKVHENLCIHSEDIQTLNAPLHHYSYHSSADLLRKMDHYSTLFAEEYAGKKTSSYAHAFCRGAWAFCKTYLLKRGFLDGMVGLHISMYNAHTTYYKYAKLCEYNRASK